MVMGIRGQETNVKYGVKEGNRGSNEILGILRMLIYWSVCWNELQFLPIGFFFTDIFLNDCALL